jgi:hypothetical protein
MQESCEEPMTDDFISEVETIFRDGMTAEYGSALPLYYSNVPVPSTVENFAVIHVIPSDLAIPINLGKEADSRNVGVIQIDVFAPKDTGAGEARRIAAFAGKLFRRKKHPVTEEGIVTFKDPVARDRGEVRGRHKQQMDIPYRYDFKGA